MSKPNRFENMKRRAEAERKAHQPVALRALDALGLALANHKHKWSRKERSLYERGVRSLVH